jgi:hypothetical protein
VPPAPSFFKGRVMVEIEEWNWALTVGLSHPRAIARQRFQGGLSYVRSFGIRGLIRAPGNLRSKAILDRVRRQHLKLVLDPRLRRAKDQQPRKERSRAAGASNGPHYPAPSVRVDQLHPELHVLLQSAWTALRKPIQILESPDLMVRREPQDRESKVCLSRLHASLQSNEQGTSINAIGRARSRLVGGVGAAS